MRTPTASPTSINETSDALLTRPDGATPESTVLSRRQERAPDRLGGTAVLMVTPGVVNSDDLGAVRRALSRAFRVTMRPLGCVTT